MTICCKCVGKPQGSGNLAMQHLQKGMLSSRMLTALLTCVQPIFLVDGVDLIALDRIVHNTRPWHAFPGQLGESLRRTSTMAAGLGSAQGSWMAPERFRGMSNAVPASRQLCYSGRVLSEPICQRSHSPYGAGRTEVGGAVQQQTALDGVTGINGAAAAVRLSRLRAFTFLRLGPEILEPHYHAPWLSFAHRMQQHSQS